MSIFSFLKKKPSDREIVLAKMDGRQIKYVTKRTRDADGNVKEEILGKAGRIVVIDGEITDCPIHPDTGVPIDGYLPHWEQVKQDVLDVTRSIKQLEWFGVDLAVTNEGIKFPEINRFPDYPAVEKYTKPVREYLLYKLAGKKRMYGYDKKPNKTLVHLPKR